MKKKSKNDDMSSDEEVISDNENNETDTINELLNEEKNTEDINDIDDDDINDIEQNDDDIDDKVYDKEDSIMYDEYDDDDNDIFTDIEPEKYINFNKKIPDNERSTRPILTKYEKVRLLGTRTKQISDGSKIFIKSKDVRSAIDIAKLELKHKIMPLKIKRYLPNGKYEIWSIKELEIR